jgi:hypothetical protein
MTFSIQLIGLIGLIGLIWINGIPTADITQPECQEWARKMQSLTNQSEHVGASDSKEFFWRTPGGPHRGFRAAPRAPNPSARRCFRANVVRRAPKPRIDPINAIMKSLFLFFNRMTCYRSSDS